MIVVRHLTDLPQTLRGATLALGNFDGVHRGHQAVIAAARTAGERHGAPVGIVTFEPHPREVFRPGEPAFRLTPLRQKLIALQDLGLDLAIVFHFTKRFAAIEADDFVTRILAAGLRARHLVIGPDFHFGRGRHGTPDLLQTLGAAHGLTVDIVAPARDAAGTVFASTAIRDALRAGDPRLAQFLLGRPFRIEGRVQHGDKRGRLLGYPTANVALGRHLMPKPGIYAVRASLAGESFDAIASLGFRPTFAGTDPRLEVYLFDFAGDLYGQRLAVDFIAYQRPEQKFADIAALKAQMAEDCRIARDILSATAPR